MSEQQIQLKSSKDQIDTFFNSKAPNRLYKTSNIGEYEELSTDLPNQYMSVRSNVLKQSQPLVFQIKQKIQVEVKVQEVKQVSQEILQSEKQDQNSGEDSIIPLSHTKREKSLSPIKNQHSIASDQHFSTSGPKLNLALMPKAEMVPQKSIKSSVKSPTSQLLNKTQQICNEPITHKFYDQFASSAMDSGRRSQSRRTQIFSSDKKHNEKQATLNKNLKAEQILNENKHYRETLRRHVLQNDIYLSSNEKVEKQSPTSKKSRIVSFVALSNSKQKEMQKLEQMISSPQKASLQYWQSIYPQSKKYITSLTSLLSEEKKVIRNWQSELKTTLRSSLFEVQQLLLQNLYEICRLTVKRWVEEEIETLEAFCNQQFKDFDRMNQNIQKKQHQLKKIDQILQNFQNFPKNDHERSQLFKLISTAIFSPQYTDDVSQISLQVKDLVSKSEEVGLEFCEKKIEKAKKLVPFQYDREEFRLDKIIYDLLKNLFKKQSSKAKLPVKMSSKKFIFPDMHIGDRIQKILEKSEVRNAETAREANFNEFSQNKYRTPMSHRKDNLGGFKIKDRQKQFEEFQSEFQMRKKNFVGPTSSVCYEQEKPPEQMPTSLRLEDNGPFEKKLSTLLKRINDEKSIQISEQKSGEIVEFNKNLVTSKNYNEYQQLLRQKKQNNRENFFRYSVQ